MRNYRILNLTTLRKFKVPISCTENPEKSLAIQTEIVRILDEFTALAAELAARKKQYGYYRDKLLAFEEDQQIPFIRKLLDGAAVKWKPFGEVCDFKNGFAFKANLFRDSGLPIIRITNVDDKNINLPDVKYLIQMIMKKTQNLMKLLRATFLSQYSKIW